VLLYTVKEKGRKPDRKPHPLPYGLRNLYRNLKSRLCPETSKKWYVHEFGFCTPGDGWRASGFRGVVWKTFPPQKKECTTYKEEAFPVMMITIKENVCRFLCVKILYNENRCEVSTNLKC
jgi:hypothetical protein